MNQPATLQELHTRLLAHDVVAPVEIAERLFASVRDELQRKYPGDRLHDLVNHATTMAFTSYFQRPEQYDPTKNELAAYLRMSAEGDLKNALRSEKKLQEKFRTGVELSQFAGNEEGEGESSLSSLQTEELRAKIRGLFPEERDWQLAQLIIDRERRVEPYAKILGIDQRPIEEQRSEVKRHKDRISKKLRRFGDSIRDHTGQE